MARLNVNPTRIQLKTLRSRLVVAKRGHKMLKDKCDELIKKYTSLVKQNYSLRKEVEEKLMKFYPKKEWAKRHLQMVLFGRYYCKAIKPSCEDCKLKEYCKEKRK